DGPSQEVTVLPALEKRVGIIHIATQSGIRRQVVIPIKRKGASMKLVASGTGDDVDGPAGSEAGGGVQAHGGDLEFLDHFLGCVHHGSDAGGVHDAAAINRHAG